VEKNLKTKQLTQRRREKAKRRKVKIIFLKDGFFASLRLCVKGLKPLQASLSLEPGLFTQESRQRAARLSLVLLLAEPGEVGFAAGFDAFSEGGGHRTRIA